MSVHELAKEWMRYSKSDLSTVRHMFEDVYPKETEMRLSRKSL